MGKPKMVCKELNEFIAFVDRAKVKRRLKAAFRRKPRPAKVMILDEIPRA